MTRLFLLLYFHPELYCPPSFYFTCICEFLMLVDSVVFCAIPIDTCNVVTETPCISDGLSTSCRGIALTSIYFIFFSSLSPKSSELQRNWNFFDILKQLCSKFNAMEKQNQLNSDALNKLCKFHSMKIANSPIIIEALLKLHHYHCIIIRRRFSHSHHFFFPALFIYTYYCPSSHKRGGLHMWVPQSRPLKEK